MALLIATELSETDRRLIAKAAGKAARRWSAARDLFPDDSDEHVHLDAAIHHLDAARRRLLGGE